jgi:hypothetical protein
VTLQVCRYVQEEKQLPTVNGGIRASIENGAVGKLMGIGSPYGIFLVLPSVCCVSVFLSGLLP